MRDFRKHCLRAGMQLLNASGGHKLLAPWTEGVGLIFMLHEVNPVPRKDFDPNYILQVTPEFLEQVIISVRCAGLDIVSLNEAHRRLRSQDFTKRFVCFTLDDGYKDNKEYAYPIFKAHDCPFTIYVPGDFPDGEGILWWRALQDIIAKEPVIETQVVESYNGRLASATVEEKWDCFDRIYWWMRAQTPERQKSYIQELSEKYNFDLKAQCLELIMTWEEVRGLADDPLVTIGAHTMAHDVLTKVSDAQLRSDTLSSIERIADQVGHRPVHMSYPYGDVKSAGPREFGLMKELGFKTAVTARKGLLFEAHKDHLTALPRVSLNGEFQSQAFVTQYLSGAVFSLWNRFQQVNVA